MKSATAKLTLALDSTAIAKAKRYAKSHHTSVSQIVEEYFTRLDAGSAANSSSDSLPPRTRRLMGILKGRVAADLPHEIGKYLRRKHK